MLIIIIARIINCIDDYDVIMMNYDYITENDDTDDEDENDYYLMIKDDDLCNQNKISFLPIFSIFHFLY